MKHIEVSRKIKLSRSVSPQELKEALVERLEKAMELERVTDGLEKFSFSGTTGSPASITRHARLDMDADLKYEGDVVRIVISGYTRPARSLTFLYWLLFFIMLMVGLLPGSIETNAETSGAMDALVFLIFGIYIITDVNRKITESRETLDVALESINTTFG